LRRGHERWAGHFDAVSQRLAFRLGLLAKPQTPRAKSFQGVDE
jgi:hypothetical protein